MDARHVPEPDDLRPGSFRRELVKNLIDQLGTMQQTLAAAFDGAVIQVPTPGTLADDQWANELHATVGGFDTLGEKCFSPQLSPIIVPPASAAIREAPAKSRKQKAA
jgi:hypothetical protein